MEFSSATDLILSSMSSSNFIRPSWTTLSGFVESHGTIYQAMFGCQLFGYALVYPMCEPCFPDKNGFSLELIEVDPDYRGKGIGSRLLQQIISDFPNQSIILESVMDERLYSFYDRHGFVAFAKNCGHEGMMLIRPAVDIEAVQLMFDDWYNSGVCEETWHDDLLGCCWDSRERRWIHTNRTYKEELVAVQDGFGICVEIL